MLFIVAEVVFGDEAALTATFLVFCEDKYPKNVVFSRVAKFAKNFTVGIELKGRLQRVCLIKPERKKNIGNLRRLSKG